MVLGLLGGPVVRQEVFAPGTHFDIRTTFDMLDGRALVFLNDARPFKRCLTFQAKLARKRAVDMHLIADESFDFEEVWSEEEPLEARNRRIAMFLQAKKWVA